jgi:hypothetical protein
MVVGCRQSLTLAAETRDAIPSFSDPRFRRLVRGEMDSLADAQLVANIAHHLGGLSVTPGSAPIPIGSCAKGEARVRERHDRRSAEAAKCATGRSASGTAPALMGSRDVLVAGYTLRCDPRSRVVAVPPATVSPPARSHSDSPPIRRSAPGAPGLPVGPLGSGKAVRGSSHFG